MQSVTDERLKIIKSDNHVAEKVVALYKQWRNLEGQSRSPDRALKSNFIGKQQNFTLDIDLPFDIRKVEAETIIQHSGTMDRREEVVYLRNQMTREQEGCVGSYDTSRLAKKTFPRNDIGNSWSWWSSAWEGR